MRPLACAAFFLIMSAAFAAETLDQAKEIGLLTRSPTEFKESNYDAREFYDIFVAQGGFEYLSVDLLGSWEFADRIENLKPDWSPYDTEAVLTVRMAAEEARRRTLIHYSNDLSKRPIKWLYDLVNFKKIRLSDTVPVTAIILMSLAENNIAEVIIKHRNSHGTPRQDGAGRLWTMNDYVTSGTLNRNSRYPPYNGPLHNDQREIVLTNFTTRASDNSLKNRSHTMNYTTVIPISDVISFQIVTDKEPKSIMLRLRKSLLENGWPLQKIIETTPHELGVRPADCETNL